MKLEINDFDFEEILEDLNEGKEKLDFSIKGINKIKKSIEKYFGEIENSETAINQFIKMYEEIKVIQNIEDEDEDMLLFEYGSYDWGGNGVKNYEFGLCRQFVSYGEDELIQFRITLKYDVEEIGEIESNNFWSIEFENIDEFYLQIKSSEGYLKTIEKNIKKIEINISRT